MAQERTQSVVDAVYQKLQISPGDPCHSLHGDFDSRGAGTAFIGLSGPPCQQVPPQGLYQSSSMSQGI